MRKNFLSAIVIFQLLSLQAQDTLLPLPAASGSSPLPNLEYMQEVELYSNRLHQTNLNTGMNVSVITSKEISQLPAQTINEVLAWVSGIDVRERGPMGVQADIGIRGSGFDQVLVLVDGVRMSDPQTGHHQMNLPVPLQMIERIEVIRGSAARRYGLNAMGGVIHIITKKRVAKTISATAFGSTNMSSSSNRYVNQGGRVYLSDQINKWNVSASADYQGGEGFRYNTDFQNFKGLLSINREWGGKSGLSMLAGHNNNRFGANDFYAPSSDEESRETVNTHFLNASFNHDLGSNTRINLNASSRWNFDHYDLVKYNYVNKHQSQVSMGELNINKRFFFERSIGELSGGLEWRQERIQSNNLGDHDRTVYGAYTEYKHSWRDRWFVTLGSYGLQTEELGFKIYPGIDTRYRVNRNWSIWGNWGNGQRLPTYTDLYYEDRSNSSNPNLISERSRNAEIGVTFSKLGFTQNLSVFQKNQFDRIDWIKPIVDPNDSLTTIKWTPYNLGTAIFRGIEGGVNYQTKIGRQLAMRISWNFCLMEGENQVNSNANQPVLSKYALNFLETQSIQSVWFNYSLHNEHYSPQISMRIQWRHMVRSMLVDPINLYDLRLKYSGNNASNSWAFFMDISNISNKQYFVIDYGQGIGLPNLPRWVQLGINYSLR